MSQINWNTNDKFRRNIIYFNLKFADGFFAANEENLKLINIIDSNIFQSYDGQDSRRVWYNV